MAAPSLLLPPPVTNGNWRGKERVMDRMDAVEERVAHLMRVVEDLSDVVARQGRELDRLTRLTGLLAEREAEREALGAGPAADQKPPHW
jgi:SlyX protein